MTKAQKEKAAAIKQKLTSGGMDIQEVGFTKAGNIRLTVSKETANRYSCTATLMAKASVILGLRNMLFGTSLYVTVK